MMKIKKIAITALIAAVTATGLIALRATADETQYITVKGSDTMVHLASSWAEAFMKAHPNTPIKNRPAVLAFNLPAYPKK